jgi:hypothetical protein
MPRTFSLAASPVIAVVVQSFCGAAVLKDTSLLDAVVATIWPSAFAGAVDAGASAIPRIVSPAFSPVSAPFGVAAPVVRLRV